MSRGLLILLAGIAIESRLDAQALNVDALCAAADQAVDHRTLPARGDTAWMLWYRLSNCGAKGARTAAAALRTPQLRGESDDARLSQFFLIFGGLRSNVLLNGYQDAAEDNSATPVVRMRAIDAMTAFLSPASTFDRAALTGDPGSFHCVSVGRRVSFSSDMDDLPNDVFDRVLNSVTRVATKAGVPSAVKQLAQCWQDQLELTVPISTGKINVSYICGNKFTVHNGNAAPVTLRYAVQQTTEASSFEVLGREDFALVTGRAGTIQVSYNGQVLATKTNTGKKCI